MAIIVALALALAGCRERTCLEFHTEPRIGFMLAGKVLIPYHYKANVCDLYAPEPQENN